MRCMACNGEMDLMTVVPDETMPVPGFEQHTFMCSLCHDVEQRLVFNRRSQETDTEPAPVDLAPAMETGNEPPRVPVFLTIETDNQPAPVHMTAAIADAPVDSQGIPPLEPSPSVPPTSSVQDERAAPSGFVRRAITTMRGCWNYLQQQTTPSVVRPLGG